MTDKIITFETIFNTESKTLIHIFSERVKIISYLETGEVKILRDGIIIRNIDTDVTISEYENLLSDTAKDAEKLESFNIDN